MDSMAVMKLVETKKLSRSFGGLQAVNEVDFSMEKGEIRAIIGPNGAGKTTFVSLLSGRIDPTAGSIWFRGENITAMPAWQRVRHGIAYTFQITSIYPSLTAYENVAIGAQTRVQHKQARRGGGDVTGQIDEITRHCLGRVGLDRKASVTAGEMAYGHQRLLEIAMGLALDPSLLILDEPTQGLSDGEIVEFEHLVKQIRQEATILLIEHNMPVVMSLADRITVMDRGFVLAEGTPGEIRKNHAVQAAYLGG
jgi:branched-chain amino acid transport system ATP-binding protein